MTQILVDRGQVTLQQTEAGHAHAAVTKTRQLELVRRLHISVQKHTESAVNTTHCEHISTQVFSTAYLTHSCRSALSLVPRLGFTEARDSAWVSGSGISWAIYIQCR